MTVATTAGPIASSLLRIAITSPDILARIRQVFASRNLDVEVIRLPYVEVIVSRAANAVSANDAGAGTALRRMDGPASRPDTATRRLSAEYRLNVIGVEAGERSQAAHPVATVSYAASIGDAPERREDQAPRLSRRQREVMALVSRGARNTEIADRLDVSEKTVKNHINRIFKSLGAANRVEAVLIWQSRQRGTAETRHP